MPHRRIEPSGWISQCIGNRSFPSFAISRSRCLVPSRGRALLAFALATFCIPLPPAGERVGLLSMDRAPCRGALRCGMGELHQSVMLVSTPYGVVLIKFSGPALLPATKSRLGGRLEGLGMDGELLFELHGPEGQIWRLYLDGRVEGFPAGTLVVNSCLPAMARMVGEVRREGISLPAEQA